MWPQFHDCMYSVCLVFGTRIFDVNDVGVPFLLQMRHKMFPVIILEGRKILSCFVIFHKTCASRSPVYTLGVCRVVISIYTVILLAFGLLLNSALCCYTMFTSKSVMKTTNHFQLLQYLHNIICWHLQVGTCIELSHNVGLFVSV